MTDGVSLCCAGLPGWVALPALAEEDALVWATDRTARDSAGVTPGPASIGAEGAAAMLASAVERVHSLWGWDVAAPVSFAYQPDPLGRVLAVLDAALFPFEDTPFAAERMTALHGAAVTDIECSTVTTRWGPADRFHGRFAARPPAGGADGPSAAVVEAVTYVLLPTGLDGYLWVDAQWHDRSVGAVVDEQVAQLVDLMQVHVRR